MHVKTSAVELNDDIMPPAVSRKSTPTVLAAWPWWAYFCGALLVAIDTYTH